MQLVRSRPIIGPVHRDGGWYEDFVLTGGKTVDLVGGTQVEVLPSNTGIRLEPVTTSSRNITLPLNTTNKFAPWFLPHCINVYF